MKTSLTLSAVLFALTLTPAAFANGAQEQTREVATGNSAAPRVAVIDVSASAPAITSFTRSVLERFEYDVRQNLIGSLRESAKLVLQYAAPALVEATSVSTPAMELSNR